MSRALATRRSLLQALPTVFAAVVLPALARPAAAQAVEPGPIARLLVERRALLKAINGHQGTDDEAAWMMDRRGEIDRLLIASHPETTAEAAALLQAARDDYWQFSFADRQDPDNGERLVLAALDNALRVLGCEIPEAVPAAPAHPDAALFAMLPALKTLWHECDDACEPVNEADKKFFALRRAGMTEGELHDLEVSLGREEAYALQGVAIDRWTKAAHELIDTPANTVEGMRLKAMIGDQPINPADLLDGLLADLENIGGSIAFWAAPKTEVA